MNHPTEPQPTLQELTCLVQEQQRQIAALQQQRATPRPQSRFPFPWLRHPSLMTFALVGLLITVSGLASASVPAANGVFTGCYDSKGVLRLIDAEAGAQCSSKEKRITWSQTGPAGPQGIPGPLGATGPAGASGISGYEMVNAFDEFSSPTTKSVSVRCPAGKVALGGGAIIVPQTPDAPIALRASLPLLEDEITPLGWIAEGIKTAEYGLNWGIQVFAICANVTTTAAAAVTEAIPSADSVVSELPAAETEKTGDDAQPDHQVFLPLVSQ